MADRVFDRNVVAVGKRNAAAVGFLFSRSDNEIAFAATTTETLFMSTTEVEQLIAGLYRLIDEAKYYLKPASAAPVSQKDIKK